MLRKEYEKELKFYQSYHKNEINWRIHAICIPLEWLAWLSFLKYIHNWLPWIVSILIAFYYLFLGKRLIIFASSCAHLLFAFLIDKLFLLFSPSYIWLGVIVMYVASWSVQIFIGHYYFEKNSPAMATRLTLNSIVLSVLMSWDIS